MATFGIADDQALREAVQRTAAFVRDDLGDACSFSLDSPKSRQQHLSYSAQGNGTRLAVSRVLDGVTKRATFAYAPR